MAVKYFSSQGYWPGPSSSLHCVQPCLLYEFQEHSQGMQTNEPVMFRTFSVPWLGLCSNWILSTLTLTSLPTFLCIQHVMSLSGKTFQGFHPSFCPTGNTSNSWRQPADPEPLHQQCWPSSALKFESGNLQTRSGWVSPKKHSSLPLPYPSTNPNRLWELPYPNTQETLCHGSLWIHHCHHRYNSWKQFWFRSI